MYQLHRIEIKFKLENTMPTLVELTASIVAAHASGSSMTSVDLLKELQDVYSSLKAMEAGATIPTVESAPTEAPAITIKQAFKNKDEVLCMICGKGYITLKRHLAIAHDLKPAAYRKQFGIPSTQSLAAKSYVESRRQIAIDKNLGAGLANARAKKKVESELKVTAVAAGKLKAPVPAVKVKAPVPVVKVKAAAPAKVGVAVAPVKTKKSSK